MISFDEFLKVELKVGTVLEAEDVEGSEKLIKLKVDLGPVIPANAVPAGRQAGIQLSKRSEDNSPRLLNKSSSELDPAIRRDDNGDQRDIRQILAGVKQWYKPKDFVGKQVIVVANLEPRKMMGLESQGMMLAADSEGGPVFLTVSKKVAPGTKIR